MLNTSTNQASILYSYRFLHWSRVIQWLKWFCEAGGLPDEARLEQTPYSFQPH